MNCPRCDTPGRLQDAPETGQHRTWRRRYECARGHRFATVEAVQPRGAVPRHLLSQALRAIAQTFRTPKGT